MAWDWDAEAESWDGDGVDRFADEAHLAFVERVLPFLAVWPQGRALDFGCGTGAMAIRLAPFAREVVGVDTSQEMIERASRKIASMACPATFVCGDVRDLQTNNHAALHSPFDVIVASSSLAFVDAPVPTLATLRSMAARGSRLVTWDWKKATTDGVGFTEDDVRTLHAKSGWVTTFCGTGFSIPVPEEGSVDVLMGVAKPGG